MTYNEELAKNYSLAERAWLRLGQVLLDNKLSPGSISGCGKIVFFFSGKRYNLTSVYPPFRTLRFNLFICYYVIISNRNLINADCK